MNNVIVEIGKKELKTTFKSKSVILAMLLAIGIPLFAIVPSLLEAAAGGSEDVYLFILMLLLIPTMITSLVGENAFLNEIKWRTIKSLLVAPVSEKEIFVGKSLACIIVGLIVEACLAVVILAFLPAGDRAALNYVCYLPNYLSNIKISKFSRGWCSGLYSCWWHIGHFLALLLPTKNASNGAYLN